MSYDARACLFTKSFYLHLLLQESEDFFVGEDGGDVDGCPFALICFIVTVVWFVAFEDVLDFFLDLGF